MRLPLLLCVTTLAAGTALAQQAGSSSPSSPSSPSTPSSSSSKSSQSDQSSQSGISSQSSQSGSIYSATGRAHGQKQHLRSTKVIGAQVKTSSGEDVGRIEDVILNPTSGRIDFAVISAEGKLAPVPWQLLSVGSGGASAQGSTSSSSSTASGTSSTDASSSTSPSSTSSTTPGSSGIYASSSASGMQPTFTLNIEKSKLQGGPSFDRSRWPEMSASWSQQVYSHFGVSASGVGGTGSGSSTIDQGSTGSSTDSKSSSDSSDKSDKSSSDPSKSSSDDKK